MEKFSDFVDISIKRFFQDAILRCLIIRLLFDTIFEDGLLNLIETNFGQIFLKILL